MDELQARIRAIRSLQTDMNLARQPDPDFEFPVDTPLPSEANVVELPNRQAQIAPQSDTAATPQARTKRKSGASSQKAMAADASKTFSFRQLRESNQQPFIDELKRLEAQAERINQLLAERARKKAYAEQTGESAQGKPLIAKRKTNDASPPAASKKKSARGTRQSQRSSQREMPIMSTLDDDSTEDLEVQAERIKQMLADLEAALIQGGATLTDTRSETGTAENAMAPSLTIDRTTTEPFTPPTLPQATTQTPPPAGSDPLPASMPSIGNRNRTPNLGVGPAHPDGEADTQKAQQEAVETAQALRYLANREVDRERISAPISVPHPDLSRPDGPRARPSRPPSKPFTLQSYGNRLRRLLQIPPKTIDRVGDAMLWIVMAAVVRVGVRLLLAMVPVLAPVFSVLMFAPAILAVYLALFVPRAGFVSVYRLFLLMLGLLIGGRL